MAKRLDFDDKARAKLREGADRVADVVQVTLGPKGRAVALQAKWGPPKIVDDGVLVAKEIELADTPANVAARLLREVADRTSREAGDGTTTATVLARAIYREGMRRIAAGADPQAVRRGIEKAAAAGVEAIRREAREVSGAEDYRRVATLSAHSEDLGRVVAEAVERVGKDGAITVEEGKGLETEIEVVEGMRLDRGYISPYFLVGEEKGTMEAVLEDPLVLVTERKISALKDILRPLQLASEAGRPLLLLAEEVEGEALATLIVNAQRGVLRSVAVKAPAYGDRRKEILRDIAILTGGTVISEEAGMTLDGMKAGDFGRVRRVLVDRDNTTLAGGKGSRDAIEGRKEQIRAQILEAKHDFDREKLEERLAKLAGGVATIHVGAPTEPALKERKERVQDAVNAVKAAAAEGVVPGGGVCFLLAARALGDLETAAGTGERDGVEAVRRALLVPLQRIAENAGQEGAAVLARVLEAGGSTGFDAERGDVADVTKRGILDATKVVRLAFGNAASIAGLMLSTSVMITEIPGKKGRKGSKVPGPPGMGEMGGF
jgi:chaperonin GroEL